MMLPIPWKKPFNTDEVQQSKNRLDSSPLDVVGLRILTRKLSHGGGSNVVVKTNLKSQKPSLSDYYSSFLRSCHLCNKTLSPHKDVYMYRGDQGFCSEECRNRQIYMDEMEAIEASAKRRRKLSAMSSSSSSRGRRCETLPLLEQFRRRRHNPLISYQKNRPQVL
ncbi:FCS-Like Zinc finger 17-like [Diospyros lotus]|uniref:FCS-Like Zinc finger 17-like n=1 Tax=Diospyros lotus TaxID=55363 RepID=UPI00225307F1|nr:FCS-Like Zinc finger 17-like [Diospyros lotus]